MEEQEKLHSNVGQRTIWEILEVAERVLLEARIGTIYNIRIALEHVELNQVCYLHVNTWTFLHLETELIKGVQYSPQHRADGRGSIYNGQEASHAERAVPEAG